jgi:hypothetical protein
MLKKVAILATFETFSLQERRELLSKLVEKSDVIINDAKCHESLFIYENIDKKFVEFLFSSFRSKIFFFKEDIYKCYRLFQIIKEKCNFVSWERGYDGCTINTCSLAYYPNSTWKTEVAERGEWNDSYRPLRRGDFFENKEEFFNKMMEYCNNGCYVCLISGGVLDLYENIYDLAIYQDIYDKYIKDWNLPPYSQI